RGPRPAGGGGPGARPDRMRGDAQPPAPGGHSAAPGSGDHDRRLHLGRRRPARRARHASCHATAARDAHHDRGAGASPRRARRAPSRVGLSAETGACRVTAARHAGRTTKVPLPTTASTAPTADTDALLDGLDVARERTLALVEPVCAEDLERVHSTLMSPLVWDLGHIAAFEDLWLVHRFGGEPMLRGGYAQVYDAFETPRAERAA